MVVWLTIGWDNDLFLWTEEPRRNRGGLGYGEGEWTSFGEVPLDVCRDDGKRLFGRVPKRPSDLIKVKLTARVLGEWEVTP